MYKYTNDVMHQSLTIISNTILYIVIIIYFMLCLIIISNINDLNLTNLNQLIPLYAYIYLSYLRLTVTETYKYHTP